MKKIAVLCMVVIAAGCNKYELDFDEVINSKNFIAKMDENPEEALK